MVAQKIDGQNVKTGAIEPIWSSRQIAYDAKVYLIPRTLVESFTKRHSDLVADSGLCHPKVVMSVLGSIQCWSQ